MDMIKVITWEYHFTMAEIDALYLDDEDWQGIEWLFDAAIEKIKLKMPKK